MRIVALIENTEGAVGCAAAHGLSLYIETARHRLLSDLGPSGRALENAERLGVDLRSVDTVILSHGHYDHAGGILPFAEINPLAAVYMQKSALGAYYADDGKQAGGQRYRYIGIDPEIAALPQLRLLSGDRVLDGELSVFVMGRREGAFPFSNARLKQKRGCVFVQDRFLHEQFLVILDGGLRVLISGCAHNGILNILAEFDRKYGGAPDAVVSGFHLMKKTDYTEDELEQIRGLARRLTAYDTAFYTCHCTGLPAFAAMKEIMGGQLTYVSTGSEILLPPREQ